MAISTQRLIVIVLMIDMMIALMGGFVYGVDNTDLQYQNYMSSYQNWSSEFYTNYPESTADAQNLQIYQQVGDAKYGGAAIFNLFGSGLDMPTIDSCNGQSCNDTNVKWVYNIIAFVIAALNILLGYELFLIFYSRKNT